MGERHVSVTRTPFTDGECPIGARAYQYTHSKDLSMDPLDFGRWQFGITTVYHFFMVPLTLVWAL